MFSRRNHIIIPVLKEASGFPQQEEEDLDQSHSKVRLTLSVQNKTRLESKCPPTNATRSSRWENLEMEKLTPPLDQSIQNTPCLID